MAFTERKTGMGELERIAKKVYEAAVRGREAALSYERNGNIKMGKNGFVLEMAASGWGKVSEFEYSKQDLVDAARAMVDTLKKHEDKIRAKGLDPEKLKPEDVQVRFDGGRMFLLMPYGSLELEDEEKEDGKDEKKDEKKDERKDERKDGYVIDNMLKNMKSSMKDAIKKSAYRFQAAVVPMDDEKKLFVPFMLLCDEKKYNKQLEPASISSLFGTREGPGAKIGVTKTEIDNKTMWVYFSCKIDEWNEKDTVELDENGSRFPVDIDDACFDDKGDIKYMEEKEAIKAAEKMWNQFDGEIDKMLDGHDDLLKEIIRHYFSAAR